jgi:hypothetical protein
MPHGTPAHKGAAACVHRGAWHRAGGKAVRLRGPSPPGRSRDARGRTRRPCATGCRRGAAKVSTRALLANKNRVIAPAERLLAGPRRGRRCTPASCAGHARRQACERLSAGWRVPAEPTMLRLNSHLASTHKSQPQIRTAHARQRRQGGRDQTPSVPGLEGGFPADDECRSSGRISTRVVTYTPLFTIPNTVPAPFQRDRTPISWGK